MGVVLGWFDSSRDWDGPCDPSTPRFLFRGHPLDSPVGRFGMSEVHRSGLTPWESSRLRIGDPSRMEFPPSVGRNMVELDF